MTQEQNIICQVHLNVAANGKSSKKTEMLEHGERRPTNRVKGEKKVSSLYNPVV